MSENNIIVTTTPPEDAPPGASTTAETFVTIIADPPWGNSGQKGKYGAISHYDLMSIDRIAAMPVCDLAADNAHLYLWCYPAVRRIAEEVMEAWGFRFVDEFIWGKDQMGLGQYFRHAHETLLLGVKGSLPVTFRGQRSFAMLPRQAHSHKPEEVHVMVQRMSPGPYLELFARRPFPGFKVWGNEVDSDVSIPGYPVPSDPTTPSEVPHA
ncbi:MULTISPECIES: MT-A70 family methyltransferase [Microbacterium]|uniref:MT-A70 family methyltransferase n=1 Tax=Microbacterium TaxID=33882 RepID=UPI00277E155E|nr:MULTISPECIES: MT-A70 family methyltransferase [Microbacterium]MDQ1084681.1 N6-adenosine-specific RNA methylase IME4 [Microbacterium sp. SORGH_AS_0344]MDQ1170042.1 N6-adenosine-specific RNA methylase IME4 [Microbacterium proteolyticum]